MRMLPVIDLLGGQVVRGVAGRRESYRPIVSQIAGDASPRAVAAALVSAFGFSDVYIADLDAIAGAPPAWGDYEAIAACGLRLWVDAGVGDRQRAMSLMASPSNCASAQRIIVGLESLQSRAALVEIANVIPPELRVFSLDLKDGRPLTKLSDWASASPLDITSAAVAAGFQSLIVLDLARVGMGLGTGTGELCRAIHTRWPEVELIGGGGVSSADDLARLASDGLDYVLVASALHDGRLTRADIQRWCAS